MTTIIVETAKKSLPRCFMSVSVSILSRLRKLIYCYGEQKSKEQEKIVRLLAEGKISQVEAQKRLDTYLSYERWVYGDFGDCVHASSTDFFAGTLLPMVRGKIPRASGISTSDVEQIRHIGSFIRKVGV